jgi:hypothetical protein
LNEISLPPAVLAAAIIRSISASSSTLTVTPLGFET